ncbi:MAG: thiamine phosphate synthase [Acidobacteriota bacterium]|jgi:thiamine-phosphate pyrophosphorylase
MGKVTLPPVYPITPDDLTGSGLADWVHRLLDAGCRFFQYRAKTADDERRLRDLMRITEDAHRFGAAVIVDDRPDLCLLAGADGVHVGQSDLPPSAVRRLLGPAAVIGFSTHSPAQAAAALDEGADYLALGPVFPTRTKTNPDPVLSEEDQAAIIQSCPLPITAIGGITARRAPELWSRGFASLAVISAFAKSPDSAWREFTALLPPR